MRPVSSVPPISPTPNKLSDRLAHTIEHEIISLGWPVHRVLGSEAELMLRHGVSRASLREAIRLLEQRGAVRMRSGPGGGLTIAAPAEDTLVTLIATHLALIGVSISEVLDAREWLETLAVRLAAAAQNGAALAAMQQTLQAQARTRARDASLDRLGELQHQLGEATGNPALQLMIDVLTRINRSCLLEDPEALRQYTASRGVIEAILASLIEALQRGDVAHAVSAVRQSVGRSRSVRATAQRREATPADVRQALKQVRRRLDNEPVDAKRAQRAAQLLQAALQQLHCPANMRLGSEAELREAIGVSAAVCRETLCILRQHALLRSGRGRGGGIYVTTPDPAQICRSAVLYLRYMKIAPRHYLPLRRALDLEAVRLAARNHCDEDRARLEAFAAAPPAQQVAEAWTSIDALQQLLAQSAGNRILPLLLRILSGLTATVERRRDVDLLTLATKAAHGADFPVWLKQQQHAIVCTVLARDEDSAGRAAFAMFDRLLDLLRQVKPVAFAGDPKSPERPQDTDAPIAA